jgi:hypothetical protein
MIGISQENATGHNEVRSQHRKESTRSTWEQQCLGEGITQSRMILRGGTRQVGNEVIKVQVGCQGTARTTPARAAAATVALLRSPPLELRRMRTNWITNFVFAQFAWVDLFILTFEIRSLSPAFTQLC